MQAPIWATTVSDHVKTLHARAEASNALESIVVKAEQDLKTTRELVQVVSDQVDAISSERNFLKEDVGRLKKKITQRNDQLRDTRNELHKEKKKLERPEEKFFLSTYNMLVRIAHSAGVDYKVLLIEGLDDPVGQEELTDEPLVVSSYLDEDLSN